MGIPLEYGLVKYQKIPSWKYRLFRDYDIQIRVYPIEGINTQYIKLTVHGWLTIKKGYCWDGCSGPTYDDSTNQRAGLVHDALYQLMRM
ncbi:MAG: hypothetical protein V3R81_12295, partial [Gammaproteobacteria bacterium]